MKTFFPEGFASNDNDAQRYFKPVKGETAKIRVVSTEPTAGYIRWTSDNRPVRWAMDAEEPQNKVWREDSKAKKFFAMVIWNYETESLQIWEVTQRSIYDSIDNLCQDPDFGHPNLYDLKITRRGEGLETTYQVQAFPSEFPSKATLAFNDSDIKIEKIFTDEDPFGK